MKALTPDLSERKRILKAVCREHAQWKYRIALAIILFIAAAGIMVGNAILLINNPTTAWGVSIFTGGAIIFASVPFFTGLSVKNTAKYKCALPYTSFANGTLFLNDDALEYVCWRVGPQEPAAYSSKRAVYRDEDKFVYSIDKKDIRSMTIENDICKIEGNGLLQLPDWATEDVTIKEPFTAFSFIMAFEERNGAQILEAWRR